MPPPDGRRAGQVGIVIWAHRQPSPRQAEAQDDLLSRTLTLVTLTLIAWSAGKGLDVRASTGIPSLSSRALE